MDTEAQNELTRALDTSMYRVLNLRLRDLVESESPEDVAAGFVAALKDLDGLRSGDPPDYGDEWLALPYLSWYGPSHINMAYTLMKTVVSQCDNVLQKGPNGAHLEDYACGTFAGQFGLVLAASDNIQSFTDRKLSIYSDDSSTPMWGLGRDLWKDFRYEIGAVPEDKDKFPHIEAIRLAARQLITRQPRHLPARVWLTVFHAAYGGDYGDSLATASTT